MATITFNLYNVNYLNSYYLNVYIAINRRIRKLGYMIGREIQPVLQKLLGQYPIVTVTGPRQSGKTTLCQQTFPNLSYANLESPEQREYAISDPRAFLAQFRHGAILDEIQRAPDLLSYLQVIVDERRENGLFVLTGSEHLKLRDSISQSLAGRTALLTLLPLTLKEKRELVPEESIDEMLFSGFYPRIFDKGQEPRQALGNYVETYIERDVRSIGQFHDPTLFYKFVRLCAGRIGQLGNLSQLGADAGVSHTTARQWISILERSYILFRLEPFSANLRKRLVKTPKLYFYDVGLACQLVGIDNARQVATHALRGALFENAVIVESLKYEYNRGHRPRLFFFRDNHGLECDLLRSSGTRLEAIEIKSGATVASDYFDALKRVAKLLPGISSKTVVYGGHQRQTRSAAEVMPIHAVAEVLARNDIDEEFDEFVNQHESVTDFVDDVAIVDMICRTWIQPVSERLDRPFRERMSNLFNEVNQKEALQVPVPGTGVEGAVFTIGAWERVKSQHLERTGYSLDPRGTTKLILKYIFSDWVLSKDVSNNLELALTWTFRTDNVSLSVNRNSEPVEDLDQSAVYSNGPVSENQVDETVTGIKRLALKSLEEMGDALQDHRS